MITKTIVAAVIAGGMSVATTGSAFASHSHFLVREDKDGTTECRYIAQGQTAKDADDPGGHQFHDNVHTGQPGSDHSGTDFDKASEEENRCDNVEDKDSKSQRP